MSLWGELYCPKCELLIIEFNSILSISLFSDEFSICSITHPHFNVGWACLPFSISNTRTLKRIGAHNTEIISVLFGSLLGDGFAEKHGNGTRFCFQQEGSHSAYLLWFHNYISELGYCKEEIPKITTRLGLHGKLRKVLRFKTFTFSSLN